MNFIRPSRKETACTSSATDWRGKKHENKNNQNTMKYHDCIEKALSSPLSIFLIMTSPKIVICIPRLLMWL